MNNRTVSLNALAFSVASLICTAAFTQSPTTPDPSRPSTQQPSTQQPSQQPGQQPRTPSGTTGSTGRMARGGLDSLEGRWNVTMRVNGMGGTPQEIKGTATRTWMLDDSVLREEFKVTDISSGSGTSGSGTTGSGTTGSGTTGGSTPGGVRDSGSTAPTGQQPGSQTGNEPASDRTGGDDQDDMRTPSGRDTSSLGDISRDFEGLGLFSFDQATNQVSHVWADSMSGGMCLSLGNFDASSKTITFTQQAGTHDKNRSGNVMGSGSGTSGSSSGSTGSNASDQDRPSGTTGTTGSGTTGSTPRPGSSTGGSTGGNNATVTLRIVSDTQHVVTMTKPEQGGQSRTYEITYMKQGASGSGNSGSTGTTGTDRNRP